MPSALRPLLAGRTFFRCWCAGGCLPIWHGVGGITRLIHHRHQVIHENPPRRRGCGSALRFGSDLAFRVDGRQRSGVGGSVRSSTSLHLFAHGTQQGRSAKGAPPRTGNTRSAKCDVRTRKRAHSPIHGPLTITRGPIGAISADSQQRFGRVLAFRAMRRRCLRLDRHRRRLAAVVTTAR